MRLLDTRTLQFVPDSELPLEKIEYAILSHRWGPAESEVSFEDVKLCRDFSNKKGFQKLEGFCKMAASVDCHYGWVDTCCIDKGNLVELSEAINSMYRWYQGSKICIAYLEDVPQKQLTESAWFDRGWTLQELIGPKVVTFFDHNWDQIGTKTELMADLARITKIPKDVLSHAVKPSACSIAQRMSWAANRVTTRVEDRAYSLIGLFDISMPMIYGESDAFLRLQRHIIRESKDESIFAWDMEFPGNTRTYSGLFAPSPSAFAACSGVIQTQGSHGFSETNGELSIPLRLRPHRSQTYYAMLNCTEKLYPDGKLVICLAKTAIEGSFVRIRDSEVGSRGLMKSSPWITSKERQIRVSVDPIDPPLSIYYGFWLRTIQPPGHDKCETTILSNDQTSEADHVCQHDYEQGVAGIVRMKPGISSNNPGPLKVYWITFSFDREFNPVLWVANYAGDLRSVTPYRSHHRFQDVVTLGNNSQEHQKLMRACKEAAETCKDNWPTIGGDIHGWQGTFMVDRKDGPHHIMSVPSLNLKISVELQRQRSPVGDSGASLNPMSVWVVDITDTGGESPEWRHRKARFRRFRHCRIYIGLMFVIGGIIALVFAGNAS